MNCDLEFLYYMAHPEDSAVNSHLHNCFELVYYVSGAGSTTIAGTKYLYQKGNIALIGPNTFHNEMRQQKTDVIFVGFRCNNPPVRLSNGVYKDTPQNDILRSMLKMKAEMLEKKAFYQIKIEAVLQELLVELSRIMSREPVAKGDFSHIESFLLENFSQEIDFHTLAEISGYSYHRFRHIFKEKYGTSPYRYVMELRLQSARRMLSGTDYSISRISLENGFNSESQFCSLFKRFQGCTPGQYRKKVDNIQ